MEANLVVVAGQVVVVAGDVVAGDVVAGAVDAGTVEAGTVVAGAACVVGVAGDVRGGATVVGRKTVRRSMPGGTRMRSIECNTPFVVATSAPVIIASFTVTVPLATRTVTGEPSTVCSWEFVKARRRTVWGIML